MPDRDKVIHDIEQCICHESEACIDCSRHHYGEFELECMEELLADALALLKEQEDLGTELTNAMELMHKKNKRIRKLEEQIDTLTKWRANAGAFD